MAETPVETEGAHGEPPPHRIVLDAPSWLPTEKFPRNVIIGVLMTFVAVVLAATIIPFALGWLDQGDFEAFGYAGIFLANFFGNYLNGYLGTFWEKMPKTQYFVMLTVMGVAAGLAMLVLSRPLNKVVEKHDRA